MQLRKKSLKKIQACQNSNPDLCDIPVQLASQLGVGP